MKLLLYCTKAKPYITRGTNGQTYPSCVISDGIQEWHLNGKIVAECDFEVEKINVLDCTFRTFNLVEKEILNKSCLTYHELFEYLKNRDNPRGYAIHIKNLHIFDEPKKLEWNCHISYYSREFQMQREKFLSKAPQNMCKVFNDDGNYILISIRPEWLCKILNGEKTIEVRKKVLKEMLKNE